MTLDDVFFRRELGRLIAALTRVFGIHNLTLAEDVAQETLARAFEAWSYRGVPAHHSALLVTAAKNRAIDVLRRQRTAQKFAPAIGRQIESEWTLRPAVDELFLPDALRDDELRMMFSCCHPKVPEEVQIALILNILCGLGVTEIAGAFLATPAAIEKRLSRGKSALAESKHLFELSADDVAPRLSAVQRALYLLFNEGYHGAGAESVVRVDLCKEAMHLVRVLLARPPTATPATCALAALMALGAARLPSRLDEDGNLRALFEQDRSRWDATLIAEGLTLLAESATGDELSAYHLEAGIAGLHATATGPDDTKWGDIVALYDALMKVAPSPVVALSRAVALAHHKGPQEGLAAIAAIEDASRLARYPFHAAALGELESRLGHKEAARTHLRRALELARNDAELRYLARRLHEL